MLSSEFLMELTEKVYETLSNLEGTSRFADDPEGSLNAGVEISVPHILAHFSLRGGGDNSFAQALSSLMEEKGILESEMSAREEWLLEEFKRLRADDRYRPNRETVAAFCLALKLNASEAERLLASAGYALSKDEVFDIILLHCLERGVFDLNDVNEALICFNMKRIAPDSLRAKIKVL